MDENKANIQDSDIPFTNVQNSYKPNALWGDIKAPYPTNRWWMNLVLENGDQPVYCYPYTATASQNGLSFFYPNQSPSAVSVTMSTMAGWSIGCRETFSSRQVESFDDMTMTYSWTSKTNKNAKMIVPFVKGSPFMTFQYQGTTPWLSYGGGKLTSSARDVGKTTYKFGYADGRQYVVFASPPVNLMVTQSGEFVSDAPYNGYLRVAYFPDNENYNNHLNVLKNSAAAIPIGVNVSFGTDTISFGYKLTDSSKNNSLLMLALPHHANILTGVSNVSNFSTYQVLKGNMYPVLGSNWVLKYKVNQTTWNSTNKIDSSYVQRIRDSLDQEANNENPNNQDTSVYTRGKTLARLARMALIADEIGYKDKAASIVNNLQENIQKWLDSTVANPLQYDTVWGGICTKQGLADFGTDYGNGKYNDHYYHYGYYMYAAAVVGKLASNGSAWLSTWKNNLVSMLNDYANVDNNSNGFTRLRHMDLYDGHSWASGLFVFGLNRNQESTSEAVNAYYGGYLYALVSGDITKANIMNLLLTSEILSAQTYWQPSPGGVYPNVFANNYIVGILWETSAQYTTWFGNNAEYIYGIQMLPFTPITFSLLNRTWLQSAWPVIKSRTINSGRTVSDDWKGFMLMAGAIVDKSNVTNMINALNTYDNGNSKTNVLWWLSVC
ncbi:hypothetical protein BB558_003690 [Smittium angustum]|uniref:glucan endo-1,3-beta-D-glucosidase n=1 Tax=Smittium angustum TaxID=133377 RepID=A0A2U1J5B6_SMIAN|nr:hypothetical protein BB558_003690 [Smittium angustum]